MKATLLFIAMSTVCATPVFANVVSDLAAIEGRRKACQTKDPSGAGLTDCAFAAESDADKILTKLYKSIVAKLGTTQAGDPDADNNKEELKRLLASQKAWIAYRDTECDLQGIEMVGGAREGLKVGACLYSLTTQRVKDLNDLFNGDVAR